MPKILSPQTKYEVISLFYQGYSRDEIAQKISIGTGTASKILESFRKEIGAKEYDAIKIWARHLRKNNIKAEDAISGTRIWEMMRRNGIKEDELNSLFENMASIKDIPNVPELLVQANSMITIRKKTNRSFIQMTQKYDELSQGIPLLDKRKESTQSEIKELEIQRNTILHKNKITEQQLDNFTTIKSECYKIGLPLKDLIKYPKALEEIKQQNYDVVQILNDLQKIGNLGNQLKKSEQTLHDYQMNTDAAKNEWKSISQILKKTRQKYYNLSEAIKIINKIFKNNQDPASIISWNEILKENQMSVSEFDSQLKKYGSFVQYMKKVTLSAMLLEQKEKKMKSNVTTLETEREKLCNILHITQAVLEQKIKDAKKEIDNFSVNPLGLLYQSKKPYEVFPILLVFLKPFVAGLMRKKLMIIQWYTQLIV